MPDRAIPADTGDEPVVYDNALRWLVQSRSPGEPAYLVDLSHFDGHGVCCCRDFDVRFRPKLEEGLTPKAAYERRPVAEKLRPYQLGPEDYLSCYHLMRARGAFARATARAISHAEKSQGARTPPTS